MGYKTDITALRGIMERLAYKEIPNLADPLIDDLSASYQDMGFCLLPMEIDDETVSNNNTIGVRNYSLKVTYKAQDNREFDNIWDKFEVLYREIHKITRWITSNSLIRYPDKQFIYIGTLEFSYGERSC